MEDKTKFEEEVDKAYEQIVQSYENKQRYGMYHLIDTKPITVNQFIEYAKKTGKYKNYCEIVIDEIGRIVILTNSSHQQLLIAMGAKKHNKSIEDYIEGIPYEVSPESWVISKEKFIAVWYDFLVAPSKINRFQYKTIKILVEHEFLNKSLNIHHTDEYTNYMNAINALLEAAKTRRNNNV